ncbi:hypothetical protein [Rossellomorea sp. YZS02]|uniref:hypothetical protein n=1 Tax=Rossellomorea sp. YZS02 TaxID=3097358 RepID=UPI002A0D13F5|nr:hypothetical protein [Rossellomorea sp. YZS02]MDX8345785.1 hypothetical protein [Rossellomorea sp. YZS02]
MLRDVCNCEVTSSFKLEADFVADPIWCNICGWNLDIDEFPLIDNLKDELYQWTKQYKKIHINKHNSIGQNLTKKVEEELGLDYRIIFIPDK